MNNKINKAQLFLAVNDLTNDTQTLNGDKSFKTLGSPIFDLFASDARLNGYNAEAKAKQLQALLTAAFAKDAKLATAVMLNIADIREGKGERTAADIIINFLDVHANQFLLDNVETLISRTRWDLFFRNFTLLSSKLQNKVIEVIKANEASSQPNLLMYKWLPSINTSSAATRAQATAIASALGKNAKSYRKWLSANRQKLNLVETNLTNKTYEKIDVPAIPKKALAMYNNALNSHIPVAMKKYFDSIVNGERKVNVDVLTPVDIFNMLNKNVEQADVLWTQQKDFLNGVSFFPVIDVSGSMYGKPYDTAVSLGIYTSERNKDAFANKVMLFSDDAKVLDLSEQKTLSSKFEVIKKYSDVASTNLDSVYQTFLNTALLVPNHLREQVIPSNILLISDMQFNQAVDGANTSAFERWEKAFAEHGIKLPKIIFWNVNSPLGTFPFTVDKTNSVMVSGYSTFIFSALAKATTDVENVMNEVLHEAVDKYFKIFDFKNI